MTNGIGWAVKQMQDGHAVRRSGWNGKGMWLIMILPSTRLGFPSGDILDPTPYVGMRAVDATFTPWLCSQTDLLATDWVVVP